MKRADAPAAIEHDVEAEGGCLCPSCSCRTEVDADIEAEEAEAAAAEQAEAEAILDGSPPDVPPPSPEPQTLPREESMLTSFEQGVELLRGVMTKPVAKFTATYFTSTDLANITDFLRQVAASKTARAA